MKQRQNPQLTTGETDGLHMWEIYHAPIFAPSSRLSDSHKESLHPPAASLVIHYLEDWRRESLCSRKRSVKVKAFNTPRGREKRPKHRRGQEQELAKDPQDPLASFVNWTITDINTAIWWPSRYVHALSHSRGSEIFIEWDGPGDCGTSNSHPMPEHHGYNQPALALASGILGEDFWGFDIIVNCYMVSSHGELKNQHLWEWLVILCREHPLAPLSGQLLIFQDSTPLWRLPIPDRMNFIAPLLCSLCMPFCHIYISHASYHLLSLSCPLDCILPLDCIHLFLMPTIVSRIYRVLRKFCVNEWVMNEWIKIWGV